MSKTYVYDEKVLVVRRLKWLRKRERIELWEVFPLHRGTSQVRKVKYGRVEKQVLRKGRMKRIWKLANARSKPDILSDSEYIYFQFENQPVIIIKKENGRTYSLKKPDAQIRHQAFFVLDILASFGFVSEYKQKTVSLQGKKLCGKNVK